MVRSIGILPVLPKQKKHIFILFRLTQTPVGWVEALRNPTSRLNFYHRDAEAQRELKLAPGFDS